MISEETIKQTAIELLKRASTQLPKDVIESLENAYKKEETEVAKMQLKAILDNIKLADENKIPMCQDTGIPIFYITLGNFYVKNLDMAIINAVIEGTKEIPLRPNAVHPLTRKNPGNNFGEKMPYINYKYSENNYIEITAFPKGAGSENKSALSMLTPSQGIKGIKEFVINTIVKAGGDPCPPIMVGIGIGGSADISMKLAKESLLRAINQRHKDKEIAKLEEELFNAINELGIGPMGLGGKTTTLGVNIEYAYCHTASLPVSVNIQCWAGRKASARIWEDGRVAWL